MVTAPSTAQSRPGTADGEANSGNAFDANARPSFFSKACSSAKNLVTNLIPGILGLKSADSGAEADNLDGNGSFHSVNSQSMPGTANSVASLVTAASTENLGNSFEESANGGLAGQEMGQSRQGTANDDDVFKSCSSAPEQR